MLKLSVITITAILLIGLTGCGDNGVENPVSETQETPTTETQQPKYRKISGEEAKQIFDENADVILLDVRTDEEFAESH